MPRVTLEEPLLPEDKLKFDELWKEYGPFWLMWAVAKRAEGNWDDFTKEERNDPSLQEAKAKVASVIKRAATEITEISFFPDTPPPNWRGPWPK